jgi:hypothetical protein
MADNKVLYWVVDDACRVLRFCPKKIKNCRGEILRQSGGLRSLCPQIHDFASLPRDRFAFSDRCSIAGEAAEIANKNHLECKQK